MTVVASRIIAGGWASLVRFDDRWGVRVQFDTGLYKMNWHPSEREARQELRSYISDPAEAAQ